MPKNSACIERYLTCSKQSDVVVGGHIYEENSPMPPISSIGSMAVVSKQKLAQTQRTEAFRLLFWHQEVLFSIKFHLSHP